jgi:signal transduction histidine kinase
MATNKISSRPKPNISSIGDAEAYRKLVKRRLSELRPILANAQAGDFSRDLKIPEEKDEFTELFVGVQTMQEVIREQIQELEELNLKLAVKASNRRRALEEAQALTHLGSWEWDIASGKISWTDELYRIFGLRPQEREIGFDDFINMIHPDDRKRVQHIVNTSYKTGESFDFEHRIILPNGQERELLGMGKVIVSQDGQPVRMIGTSQDITKQKQLDRAKDEFISLVSHQLRTPLTIIRLYGNMLSDGIAGPLAKTQQAYVSKITNASVRLIKLVGDILNISRLELNRSKIDSTPTDANALIRNCLEELTPVIKAKGATVIFTPHSNVARTPLDATLFSEIVHNLVGNALRYGRDNNGEVGIDFVKRARGYTLKIHDNGLGIPKQDQPHVFERFYRAHNAASIDSDGSGLGLYMVKLFTEASGGKVWFKSTEGKGTAFYIQFPPSGMRPRKAIE